MSKKKNHTPYILRFVNWAYPKAEVLYPPLAYYFFMKLFFTPLKYKTPDKEKKAASFSDRFTVTVANKKIQCYRWGNSERTVLLIHGWAGRATQFRRFIKPLNIAGYQVIGFDGPAHGQSEGKRTNIMEFGEALKAIYSKIGKPEAIIAHSFGGPVALVAAMNGLAVKTLVTIASPTIGDEIINTYLKVIGGTEKTKIFFKKEILRLTGKPFDEFTSMHAIKRLTHPVNLLLVYDEDDKEIALEHPRALMEVYPEAELLQTKGLGHNRILKDDEVIRHVVTFIQGQSSA